MSPSRSNNTWLADQPLQRKIVLAIGLLLGLFLVTSAITLHSLRQQQSDRYWSMHTYQVLLQLDQVQRAAQTSQLAARDYLRTRRRDAVENAVDDLRTHLATLRQLTSDNPLQRSRIDKLETMATQWHDEFRHGLIEASTGMQASEPAQAALERLHLQTDYLEHRTVTVEDMSAVLDQMVEYENKLLAERNQQLDGTLSTTRVINAAAALLGILLGIAVIRLTLALVTRPLRKLTTQLTRLANHDHDFEIHRLDRRDEIGEIARALHVFRQMSRDTQAQSWIKEQVSGISQLLLQATTRREFAQWLTSELVPLCDSAVGLFYSYDDAHRRLELLGSHGLPLIHRPDAQHLSGEDLLEQCVAGRKAIILDDAPVDCLPVAPSADDAPPRHLAIIPVLYRDTLIGVLELAGHGALSPLNLQLLEELLPIVALNLENLTHRLPHTLVRAHAVAREGGRMYGGDRRSLSAVARRSSVQPADRCRSAWKDSRWHPWPGIFHDRRASPWQSVR